MLAYVFWHRRKHEFSRDEYEDKLKQFHVTLNRSNLEGFNGSLVARITGATWLRSESDAYEDWYLMKGSEVLDRLNETAVNGVRKEPHDDIARLATDFKGGLYQLKTGVHSSITNEFALWLSKPFSTSYEAFYKNVAQYQTNGSVLWRRQMTLGPTPEFCLISPLRPVVPAELEPIPVSRQVIWKSIF